MKLGQKVKVDGNFHARIVAGPTPPEANAREPGVTVKFTKESLARVTDRSDALYLKRTGGMVFFPPEEYHRLAPIGVSSRAA